MSGQATLANSFLYEHSDVPPGVSLKDWRPAAKAQRPSRARRVRTVAAPSALGAIMRRGGAVQSP